MQNTESSAVTEHLNHPMRKDLDDAVVEAFVATHPNGASLEEIAQVLGMTRTRVGQIVKDAIAKCLRRANRLGVTLEDLPRDRDSVWERLERG